MVPFEESPREPRESRDFVSLTIRRYSRRLRRLIVKYSSVAGLVFPVPVVQKVDTSKQSAFLRIFARTVKQKVWNEAESGERDRGFSRPSALTLTLTLH